MADSIFGGLDLSNVQKAFQTNTSKSMSTVKESTLTPADVTGDKLKSGVAKVKPTDTSVLASLTQYRSEAVSELDGIIGMLSGGLLNKASDITKAIKIGSNGSPELDTDDLLSAVSGNMGYQISGQKSGLRKIAASLSSEFKALTGLNLPNLLQSDGTGFKVNGNWRGLVGQETLRQINKFTGIDQFIDVSVQTAMYNTVMKQAAQLGMKDSYKSIYDLYKVKRSADQIMVDTVRTMIANGDIDSVDAVLAILDQQGVNAINAAYPEFIETLFRSFHFEDDVFPEDYDALRVKLLSVLTRVVGPSWWLRSTQFGMAYNLALINQASGDMITLLSPVTELQPLLAAAGKFSERSAASIMKSNFKDAPVYATYL